MRDMCSGRRSSGVIRYMIAHLFISMFVLGLTTPGAVAQPDTPRMLPAPSSLPSEQQVALDEKMIEHFIICYPAIHERIVGVTDDADDNAQSSTEFDRTVQEFGFPSFENWQLTADSIMIAYHWKSRSDLEREVESAERDINLMTTITDEEKAGLITGLREALVSLQKAEPTKENLAAVEPYRMRLKEIFEPEHQ